MGCCTSINEQRTSGQSPINIQTELLGDKTSHSDVSTEGWDCVTGVLKNTGSTLKFICEDGRRPSTTINGTIYTMAEFHFHWSAKDGHMGSEHTINSRRSVAEVHFVHYKHKYGSVASALATDNKNALLVVAFLIDQLRDGETDNIGFRELSKHIPIDSGMAINIEGYDICKFADPSESNKFYKYDGSLTTPDYNESVLWMIAHDPVRISSGQIAKLKYVPIDCNSGGGNFREAQMLVNRKVELTNNTQPTTKVHTSARI
eukprot:230276_1